MAGATVTVMPTPSNFEYTATGLSGEQRNTMLANELHLRSELGKSRRRGHVFYPGPSFAYGTSYPPKDIGVAESLRWNTGPTSGSGAVKSLSFHDSDKGRATNPRDFIRLNRAAIDAGLVTSREQSDYRAKNDMRQIPKNKNAGGKGSIRDRGVGPRGDVVYGRPVRPSTPIHELIGHKFQDEWLDRQRNIQLARAEKAQVKKLPRGTYRENHTSQLRSSCLLTAKYEEPLAALPRSPPWTISRFSKSAQSHLSTFRSQEAKDKAFECHSSDRAARQGIHGNGIY